MLTYSRQADGLLLRRPFEESADSLSNPDRRASILRNSCAFHPAFRAACCAYACVPALPTVSLPCSQKVGLKGATIGLVSTNCRHSLAVPSWRPPVAWGHRETWHLADAAGKERPCTTWNGDCVQWAVAERLHLPRWSRFHRNAHYGS